MKKHLSICLLTLILSACEPSQSEQAASPNATPSPAPTANSRVFEDTGLTAMQIRILKALDKRLVLPRSLPLGYQIAHFTVEERLEGGPGSGLSLELQYSGGGRFLVSCASSGVGSLPVDHPAEIEKVEVPGLGNFDILPFQGQYSTLILDEIEKGGLYCTLSGQDLPQSHLEALVKTLVAIPPGG